MDAASGQSDVTSIDPSIYRVLTVEDSEIFQTIIASLLTDVGYTFAQTGSGAEAREVLADWNPDLVILDLGLPDVDGMDLCQEIRSNSDAFIVMLTGRQGDDNKFAGLAGGADAYVTKPFERRELLVPIEVLLRRRTPNQTASSMLEVGDVQLDRATRQVWVDGAEARLTKIELSILQFLLENRDHVATKEELVAAVWGPDWVGDHHVIRVHVANLRKKVSADGSDRIATVRGVGYRLLAPSSVS